MFWGILGFVNGFVFGFGRKLEDAREEPVIGQNCAWGTQRDNFHVWAKLDTTQSHIFYHYLNSSKCWQLTRSRQSQGIRRKVSAAAVNNSGLGRSRKSNPETHFECFITTWWRWLIPPLAKVMRSLLSVLFQCFASFRWD